MVEAKSVLVGKALPPIVLGPSRPASGRGGDTLPRLGRLAWLLAAFSLPVLGLSFADLVHREGGRGTMQAAAPFPPSNGVAVPTGVTRATHLVRVAPPRVTPREDRV